MGVILLILFAGTLSIGKNIIFTNFTKTNKPEDSAYRKNPSDQNNDVIDVEAQVFEDEDT